MVTTYPNDIGNCFLLNVTPYHPTDRTIGTTGNKPSIKNGPFENILPSHLVAIIKKVEDVSDVEMKDGKIVQKRNVLLIDDLKNKVGMHLEISNYTTRLNRDNGDMEAYLDTESEIHEMRRHILCSASPISRERRQQSPKVVRPKKPAIPSRPRTR
ncbi:unnamed protein product [Trichogramma brassicae]|uniref:Uncharacterized protein n=1 Tax=Trichogramma brassicae TaxID=86971 RepID=A0A6H5I695_9HYME|nr:unnamed protein product [Trichogramma brassicae]